MNVVITSIVTPLISTNKLKNNFNVDKYDIGIPFPTKKYNCIILSHVLEHIYDINTFSFWLILYVYTR